MIFPLQNIAIIGLGHMGASIAAATRENMLAEQIIGLDNDESALRYCQQYNIVDKVMPIEAISKNCELIIIASPPSTVGPIISTIADTVTKNTVVTDIASVKLPILQYVEQNIHSNINFIAGHPIAGGTNTGPQNANSNLFARKLVMLTPAPETAIDDPALMLVQSFWQHLDAIVEIMNADMHDVVYGYVSHLPHIIAYAANATIYNTTLNNSTRLPDTLFRFIRLGNSNAALWCDILWSNKPAISQALDTYISMLQHIANELTQEENSPQSNNQPSEQENINLAITTLFPRIAASCLVATVAILERHIGQKLAIYSGAGFADVASPAAETPESDMEAIAYHHRSVKILLNKYTEHLMQIASALTQETPEQLLKLLQDMQQSHIELNTRIG